jgi:hypothetical protein
MAPTSRPSIKGRALPASERAVAFARLWTRKEALAKVDGRGIASRLAAEPLVDSQCKLYSFGFNLGDKEIVVALVLGADLKNARRPM